MPTVIISGAPINLPDIMTSRTAGLSDLNISSQLTNCLQNMSLPPYLLGELREGRGALEIHYTATSKPTFHYTRRDVKKEREGVRCKLNGIAATYEVAIQYRDGITNQSYPLFDLTFNHALSSRDVSLKDPVQKIDALTRSDDEEIATQNRIPYSEFLQNSWTQATLAKQKNVSAAVEARVRSDRATIEEIQAVAAVPDARPSVAISSLGAEAAAEQTPHVKVLQEKLAKIHGILASLANTKQTKYVGKAATGQTVSPEKWAKLQTLQELVRNSQDAQQLAAGNVQANPSCKV